MRMIIIAMYQSTNQYVAMQYVTRLVTLTPQVGKG